MTQDRLPYEIRKGSNVINPNPVETVKIPRIDDELDWKLSHYNYMEAGDLIKALRAIVELHSDDHGMCMTCEMKDYPCPTIQAIEKELR